MLRHLTEEIISGLMASRSGRVEIADAPQSGLRLRLGARTANWSVFVSGPRIEKVRVGLGTWPQLSIEDARLRAQSVWGDYRAARNCELESDVFEGLLERYAEERLEDLRTGSEILRALRHGLGDLLLRYPWTIGQKDIELAINQIAQAAPQQANRTLSYAKTLFSWAQSKGYVQRSPAANVAPRAAVSIRTRTLSEKELVLIWDASEFLSAPRNDYVSISWAYPFGHIVKLLILIGCRKNLIANIRIEDLVLPQDSDRGIWVAPTDQANGGQRATIHLTPLIRRVIEDALMSRPAQNSPLLFATTAGRPVSGWSSTKQNLDGLTECEKIGPWRFDDIRRTYATFTASLPKGGDPAEQWAVKIEEWILRHSSLAGGSCFPSSRADANRLDRSVQNGKDNYSTDIDALIHTVLFPRDIPRPNF